MNPSNLTLWQKFLQSLKKRERRDRQASEHHRTEILEGRIAPAAVLTLNAGENSTFAGDGASDITTVFNVDANFTGFYNSGGLSTVGFAGGDVVVVSANEVQIRKSVIDGGTLTMTGGGGTDDILFNAGLQAFDGLSADYDTVQTLPALSIGGGGLSVTASAGSIVAGGAITLGSGIALTASGDITVSASISKTSGGAATADLRANASIIFNSGADLISTSGALTTILNADRDASGQGGVFINAGGTAITTNGGDFTIGGGATPASTPVFGPTEKAIYMDGVSISTGAGNISIRGQGDSTSGGGASIGMDFTNGTSISTTGGNITLIGTGGAVSDGFTMGVSLYNGSSVNTATGAISITGSSNATGSNAYGVKVQLNSKVEATGDGTITVSGTGGSGSGSDGVALFDNADIVSQGAGAISITGAATNGSAFNSGSGSNDINVGKGASGTYSGALTISADTINLSNLTLQSSGALVLQPVTATTTMGFAGGAGTFNLTASELATLADGFNSITLGRSNGNAAVAINAVTFTDPVTIRVPSGGTISVAGQITGSGNASITLDGAGATTDLGANIVTAGNAVTISDSVRLTSNALIDTTNAGGSPAGAAISILGATNADAVGNNRTFTLTAGTGGAISVQNVGVSTNVQTFTVTSGASASLQRVDTRSGGIAVTASAITLNGNLTTDALSAAGSVSLTGPVTLGTTVTIDTDSTTDGNISFSSTINGTAANTQSLTLTAGTGSITLGGAIGGGTTLSNLTTTSGSAAFALPAVSLGGNLSVTTAAAITDSGALSITGTTTLTPGAGNSITLDNANNFGGSVTVVNGLNATLNDTGAIDFAGVTLTGALTVTAAGLVSDSGTLVVPGTTSITAGSGNNVTLDTVTNNFGSVTIVSGNDVTLMDVDAITLNASTVSGTFGVTAAGITVGGAISAGGDTTFASSAGITFNNAVTMAVNKNFTASALGTSNGTISLANTSADLTATGTGAISLTTVRDITLASGSSITTVNGAISLSANQQGSPTSGNFYGVYVNGGTVAISGTGLLDVKGKGGTDAGGDQRGVYVQSGGTIRGGTSGVQSVTGTGGPSSSGNGNHGVYVIGTGSTITSGGGAVSVTGIGGGAGSSNDNRGVSVQSAGQITAGSSGTVTVAGTGGNLTGTGGSNYGVVVSDASSTISSGGGAVSVTGTGGGAGTSTSNYGVFVFSAGQITAGSSGTVSVTGTGGASTGSGNRGVFITGSGSTITSAGGNVQVIGQGGGSGASASNVGVDLISGLVSAGGLGTVTVQGIGGATGGSNNFGVHLQNSGAQINSGGGNVQVTGQGGGSGASGGNIGVYLQSGGVVTVTAGGSGSVTVQGTGGASTGASNNGVLLNGAGALITSGGGNVQVTGVEGGGASGIAVRVLNSGTITTATNGGSLTIIGNSMLIDTATATISANAANSVTLRQFTNGVGIEVGSATDTIGGPLGLSDAELDRVTAGTLQIGNSNSGAINVSTVITQTGKITNLTTAGTTTVLSGGDLGITGTVNSPLVVNSGGIVRPGTSPGVINSGDLTFTGGSSFVVEVNGSTPGTQHDQLNVTGTVALGGSTLTTSGTITSLPGQKVVIINNDGVDAVTGTFSGLPEGTTVTISGVNFYLSYVGGTGNDVVLSQTETSVIVSAGSLFVTDTTGGTTDDTLTITLNGANVRVNDPNNALLAGAGTTQFDVYTVDIPLASITGNIQFNTLGGNDQVTLDFSGGSFLPAAGLSYAGGAGGNDKLAVLATSAVQYTPSATTPGDGSITVAGSTISFTQLEPVDFDFITPSTFTLVLPGAADIVNIANGSTVIGGLDALVISGTSGGVSFETAHVRDASGIVIDTTTVAGTDAITITSASNAHNNAALTITTGAEAGDLITVNGTTTLSGTTTLNAKTINLNANITNAVTGTVATAVNVTSPGQIQDGINVAAAVGATVTVGAGTFAENVVIPNKTLTLRGAQFGVDARGRVVGAPNSAVETVVAPASGRPLELQANPGGVIVDGFAFLGSLNGAVGVIESTTGNTNGLQLLNNYVAVATGFTASALFLNKSAIDATIDKNVFVASPTSSQSVIFDGPDSFHGLYFTNNQVLRASGVSGTGIFVDGNHNVSNVGGATRNPLIKGNTITGFATGANLGSRSFDNGAISENTFTGNSTNGLQGGPQHTQIVRNTFDNNGIGIAFTSFGNAALDRGAQFDTVSNNFFLNNATEDIFLSSAQGAGTISSNTITGNSLRSTVGIIYNGTETINASANWWNSITGPTIASNVGGAGAQITGTGATNIDYTPWFNLGTDTAGTAGFQADYSLLTVNAGSAQFGGGGRITEGLGLLADGSVTGINRTVFAKAGTYAEAVNINLAATLNLAGNITINSLTGLAGTAVQLNASTLSVGDATSTTYPGTINSIGAGGLTKQGGGTLTLSNTNGYTGATLISGGALSITGSIANSAVTVGSTGTLTGTGTTGAVTVNSGGFVVPGLPVGILNTGSAGFASGSTFTVEVNGNTPGTGHDQLNVTGTVALGGALLSSTGTITSSAGQTIVLINNDGADAVTGTFNALPEGSTVTINGVDFAISYSGGTGNDVVLFEADTNVYVDGSGNLHIDDVNTASNDSLTIQSNTGASVYVISNPGLILYTNIPGATGSGTNTLTVPFAPVTGPNILVNTFAGNDSLTVNFALGNFGKIVTYDGGTQTTSDSLTLSGGGTFTNVTHTFLTASSGNVAITGNSQINYAGLEPVFDNLSVTNRVFDFTGAAETITVVDVGGADGNSQIDSTLGESVNFTNPTSSLEIRTSLGAAGADSVTISSIDTAYRASTTITTDSGDTVNLDTTLTLGSATSAGNFTVANASLFNLNASISTDAAASAGFINITGPVRLGANVVLDTDSTSDGSVTFNSSIDDDVAGGSNRTLTITADTGAVTLSGAIGASQALNALTVTSASTASLPAINAAAGGISVTAGSIALGGNLSTAVAGGNILLNSTGPGTLTVGQSIAAGTGTVRVLAGVGGINQTAGAITGAALGIISGGAVTATSATNNVSTVAANLGAGAFSYTDADALTVGSVAASGAFAATSGVNAVGNATINSGALTIANNIDTTANVVLNSTGAITETTGAVLNAALLDTDSVGGQTLNQANTVLSFNAGNTTGGNVNLTNTATTLAIVRIVNPAGDTTVTNTGNVQLGDAANLNINVSGIASITAAGVGSAITDGNAGTNNITALAAILAANSGIGTAANEIETNITNLEAQTVTGGVFINETSALNIGGISAVNGVSATSGDIEITTGGALTIAEQVSTANNVTLTAGGAISETTGAINGALLTTSSTGGTTLNNANTVTSFNATNTTSGGVSLVNTAATLTITGITNTTGATTVSVNNTGAIALGGNIATTGASGIVSLTATGAITHTSGTISGDALTLDAGGVIGASGAEVLTSVNSLTTTSGGDQFITEANGLTALNLNAGANNITLALTAGALTDNEASTDVIANTFTVTAPGGIGTGAFPINTTVSTIAFTASGGGNVFITESNGATVSGTTGSGTIDLQSTTGNLIIGGNITTTGNTTLDANAGDILRTAGTVSGAIVTLNAGGADGDIGASGAAIETDGTTINFSGAGTGDVFITEANGANVSGSTGSGLVTLLSTTGDWTVNSTGVSTTGNVSISATTGNLARSGGGAVVAGNLVTLNAGGGFIGASSPRFLTSATTLVFAGSNAGDVFITESNGAFVSGSTGSGAIDLISTTGDWTINGNITTSGSVTMVATTGDILRNTAGATVSGSLLTLTAGGGSGDVGSGAFPILTNGATIAFTGTGSGNVFITEANGASISGATGSGDITLVSTAGSFTLGLVSTSTASGNVFVTAANQILDGNVGANNIAAFNTVLTSGSGVGLAAGKLDTTITNLEGTGGTGGFYLSDGGALNIGGISAVVGVSATSGDIMINTGGALTISELVQTPGNVMLTAGGAITETGGAIVTPATLTTVSAGAQTLNSLANQIGTFTATNTGSGTGISLQNNFNGFTISTVTNQTGGDVFINNAGTAATIAGVIKSGNPVLGGDITIQTAGLLTVNNTVDSRNGSGGTLTLGGLLLLNSSPFVGFGDVTLQGGAGPLTINAPISVASPLVLQSVEDVNILASVETTSVTSDITVLADLDGNGTGGVYIGDNLLQGSLKAGRNLDVRGSEYLGSFVPGLANMDNSVIIQPNGANPRLEAVGDVLVKNNGGADFNARIWLGGLVRSNTNGDVTFDNAVRLIDDAARVLTHSNGDVIFLGAIDGAFDLRASTDTGVVLFNGAVGTVTRVGDVLVDTALDVTEIGGMSAASFTVGSATGTVDLGGPVNTNGTGTNLSINSTTLLVNNTVAANGGNILWQTDNIAVNGATSGTGTLTIQPVTVNRSIGLNGTGDLNLTQTEINLFQNGFSQITIGRTNGTGTVTTNGVSFIDPVTILSPAVGGVINANGTIAGTGDASVTLQAPTINFNVASLTPVISTEARLVHAIGNVRLLANTLIDTNFAAAGGDVTFDGTINGDSSLTIDAGDFALGGTVNINGGANSPGGASVGGGTNLTSVTIGAGTINLHPQVITSGPQTYSANNAINTFAGALRSKVSGAITLDGPVNLNDELPIITSGGAGADVIFTGVVNSTGGNNGALRIDAGASGNVSFAADAGGLIPLEGVEVTRANNIVFSRDLTVTAAITLDAAEINFNGGPDSVSGDSITLQTEVATQVVRVGGAADSGAGVLDITAGDIAALDDGFTSIIIARAAGTAGLTIDAAGVTFSDPVTFRQSSRTGFIDVLGDVTGTDNASLTFTGGATNLGADLTTAGGAIRTDYANLTTDVNIATSGGTINFANALLDTGAGGHALTITAGAGDVNFTGSVGTVGPVPGAITVNSSGVTRVLSSLVAKSFETDAAGSTVLKGNQIKATDPLGNGILIADAITLNSSMRILTSGAAGITLGAGVNSLAGKTYSLTLQAGQGDIVVNGNVGNLATLTSLTVRSTGDVSFTGAVAAKAVNMRSLTLALDDVTTSGAQTYKADTVDFNGAISAGKLTVTATTNLASTDAFTVTGLATFKTRNTANIVLTNAANTFGSLSLAGNSATIVESNDTAIVTAKLSGTLDLTSGGDVLQTGRFIADTLTVDAGGTISFNGALQKIAHLGAISGVGDIVIAGGGGDLSIDGIISTTNGDVIISANSRLTNYNVINTVGANAIQITGAGRFLIYSYSSAGTSLNSLAIDFSETGKRYPTAPAPVNTGDGVIYVVTV